MGGNAAGRAPGNFRGSGGQFFSGRGGGGFCRGAPPPPPRGGRGPRGIAGVAGTICAMVPSPLLQAEAATAMLSRLRLGLVARSTLFPPRQTVMTVGTVLGFAIIVLLLYSLWRLFGSLGNALRHKPTPVGT